MSGRVYLLGAGFSMAVSSGLPDESKMPDMRGLSDAVVTRFKQEIPGTPHGNAIDHSALAISEAYVETVMRLQREGNVEALEALANTVRDQLLLFLVSGFGTPLEKNFEQWLSFLIESPPWLSPAELAQNRATFLHIADAIATILTSRQESTITGHNGNCPDWLLKLVDLWDRQTSTVITFNYDQLVELAWLTSGSSSPSRTSSCDLYPAPLTPLGARTGNAPPVSAGPRSFELLKLHGSIGWWYSGPDGPPGDIVYDQGLKGGGWIPEGLDAIQQTPTTLAADRVPMIVPPAAVKSPYYNNSILRALWKSAADALRNADEVILMGFSLPPTDMLVSSMLCTNVSLHCTITPVNPYPDIIERICATFAIEPDSERLNMDYVGTVDAPMWDAIPKWIDDWHVRW